MRKTILGLVAVVAIISIMVVGYPYLRFRLTLRELRSVNEPLSYGASRFAENSDHPEIVAALVHRIEEPYLMDMFSATTLLEFKGKYGIRVLSNRIDELLGEQARLSPKERVAKRIDRRLDRLFECFGSLAVDYDSILEVDAQNLRTNEEMAESIRLYEKMRAAILTPERSVETEHRRDSVQEQ